MKWEISENRIPTLQEVRQLVKCLKTRSDAATMNGLRQPVIDWAVVHTLIGSGIRSHELAQLAVADLRLGHGEASIIIQHGKGGKSRVVAVTEHLKKHLLKFMSWRMGRGEHLNGEAPLFQSERGAAFTTRAIRHLFKRSLKRAGVDTRYGVHSIRHFHLSALYAKTNDLRMVQDQAGHSSVNTTTIYTHVSLQSRQQAVGGLF